MVWFFRRTAAAVTASTAGIAKSKLPVISRTIKRTATGAWDTLPKTEIIPMTTKTGIADTPTSSGKRRCSPLPSAPPKNPPTASPGANTPPDAPLPMVNAVARIFTNGSRRSTVNGRRL